MPPRFKELYKVRPSGREVRQRRLSQETQLRRFQREQVFMGKRPRFRLAQQESETESEYELTPSEKDDIAAGLKSSKHEDRVSSLTTLSMKLEQPSEQLRQFVLEGDCIDILIGFLSGTDPDEKLQSLWCLTNIAAGEARLADKALAAVPYLLVLLNSDNAELQNQAIWATGNLAAEGEAERNKLYANGVLAPLVEVASTTNDETILQTACFALSNMARKPNTYFSQLFELGLPAAIARQLEQFGDNVDCVSEMAWVCAYLTAASSEQQLDQIIATGAIDKLLQCTLKTAGLSNAKLIPVIRTLGNIAAGTDAQTHGLVAQDGVVRLLMQSIENTTSRAVEKESLWVLSNITAGGKDDVDAVVRAGVIGELARIIDKENFDIKKEAAHSLLNIAIVGERASDLPNERLVPEFVEFVRSQDEELVRMGIQYIAVLFEQLPRRSGPSLLRKVAGGIDALENQLAVTEDDATRSLVSALIDAYYSEDLGIH